MTEMTVLSMSLNHMMTNESLSFHESPLKTFSAGFLTMIKNELSV